MNRIRKVLIFTLISASVLTGTLLSSCKKKSLEGMIVFTEVSAKSQEISAALRGVAGPESEARIAALNIAEPGIQPVILTKDFYSAWAPEISFDGTKMLFSAKKKQDENWQIWEMNLVNSEYRQVASLSGNCYYPTYLPNGRVMFSRQSLENNPDYITALVSCNADGSDVTQVTFNPYRYTSLHVLKDGRVLAISRPSDPGDTGAVFMVLRPDGTKNELFYNGSEGSYPDTRGWETANGRIVFVVSDNYRTDKGEVISVGYNSPFHTHENLTSGIEGNFISVFPQKSGKLLVSYRRAESDRYGLYEFDVQNKVLGKAVYVGADFDVVEIVAVEMREKPKKLPSEVDMGVKTGLLLCQDLNVHNAAAPSCTRLPDVNKIRIIGKDSILGEIDAAKDGSFYLKVIADTPFKIQSIDDRGNVVGKSCEWLYLRPNERRGCVGCHEDPELVPQNKISLAVKKAPVNVPVHISKVVEKKVSLE